MKSYRDVLLPLPKKTVAKNLKKPPKIRTFYLERTEDESGVSGTGVVAVGVELPSKRCLLEWISKVTPASSLGIYDNIDDVEAVHGHDGRTKVVWTDKNGS